MSRLLSYTEVSTAMTCMAQWDFAYGGRLAGTTLKPRQTAPILSDGRAWGAGVAKWHETGDLLHATAAMYASLNADAFEEHEKGFPVDVDRLVDQMASLSEILDHHIATTERLSNLSQLEGELNVPIPSRGGKRGSNRYRFHCYIDGHTEASHPWIVEFKLRGSLTDPTIIEKQPQYRWYALAYALQHNSMDRPVGVLVDERLKAAPKEPRILKNGKPSHDVRQMTTPGEYIGLCARLGEETKPDVIDALRARRWHQRVDLVFTPDELREAAEELRTAAKLIRDLDSGELYPIRNGKRGNCQSCRYSAVCQDPTNDFLINSMFTRTEPKRLRPPKPEGVR